MATEKEHRKKDAREKVYNGIARQLHKVNRRAKDYGDHLLDAQWALNPDADPEEVADRALASIYGRFEFGDNAQGALPPRS